MSKSRPVLSAIALWLVIYFLGLRLVPSLGPLAALVRAHSWLSRGDISQVTFLLCSLLAIALFRRGRPAAFGFRGTSGTVVVKAVAWSASVSLVFVVLSSMAMMLSGSKSPGGQHPMLGGGLLKTVLTVWILASICEEIFYRGVIQGVLTPHPAAAAAKGMAEGVAGRRGRQKISLPVLISALTFGLGHLCLLGAMPPPAVGMIVIMATFLGLIAGRFREESGSLLPAVAAHMTFNIVGTIVPMILSGVNPVGK